MAFKFNPITGNLDLVGAGSAGSSYNAETFTLNGTDITNKYVTLGAAPSTATETVLIVRDGPGMFYGSDYSVSGSQLSWSGLALDGILSSGDKITVIYN